MLLQPLLQLRSTLGQFGSDFRGIAHRLAGFNLPVHLQQFLFVLRNILRDGFDLCVAQVQGRRNLGIGPPSFKVVQDVPDGDPCACTTDAKQKSCLGGGKLNLWTH